VTWPATSTWSIQGTWYLKFHQVERGRAQPIDRPDDVSLQGPKLWAAAPMAQVATVILSKTSQCMGLLPACSLTFP
jgi:hypothetical protein